jgi:hypothetical protein
VNTRIPALRAFAAPCSGVKIPRVCCPSDSSTIAPGIFPSRRVAYGRLHRLHGKLEPVADRRACLRGEQVDPLVQHRAVRRRDDQQVGAGAEGDQADLHALRHVIREGRHRVLRRPEPRRLHVGGPHRPGDVDQQHDRRAVRRHGHRCTRPRERDRRGRERKQEQRERHPPPPRAALLRDRREHVEVREGDGVSRPSLLEPQREQQCCRNEQQGDQQPRRGERHGAHSAPTCTIACASIDNASVAATVTTTFPCASA